MTTRRTNALLSSDWGISSHFQQCDEYGTTTKGGFTIFGFVCEKCQQPFRSDYRSARQFEASVVSLVAWAKSHDHLIGQERDTNDAGLHSGTHTA